MNRREQGLTFRPPPGDTGAGHIASAGEAPLSPEEQERFAGELWELLGRQSARYLMGDSTSLPVEQAQELLRSIRFTVEAGLDGLGPAQRAARLRERPVEDLFREGQAAVRRKTGRARQLLQAVQSTALENGGNIGYRDTLAALPHFFRRYDGDFFAHQVPCDIDYPLCNPLPDNLEGVACLDGYLRRLLVENRFCRAFSPGTLRKLWQSASPDWAVLLVNLFEPVFSTALGLWLLGEEPRPLAADPRERELLSQRLRETPRPALPPLFRQAAGELGAFLDFRDSQALAYLAQAAEDLSVRTAAALASGNPPPLFFPA